MRSESITGGIRTSLPLPEYNKGDRKMSVFTRKIKSFAAVLLACSMIMCFTGCEGEEEEVPTKTVTMTNEFGEIVTDDSGEPVMTEVPLDTIPMTNEDGTPVTDENGDQVFEYEKLPEEEKIVYKVGFVYSGYVEDGATNGCFEVARAQIERSLGLETCYMENVLVADFPEAVNVLEDEGCNIIVACSPKFDNSAVKENKVANGTSYIAFGGDSVGRALSSFNGALYETAAVCGLAAAHNTRSNVIGVVSDPGEFNAYGVIDGFVLGAADIWNTHTDVRVNWAWSNNKKEIEDAVDDLIVQGCDVIMSYMESDYAVKYAASKGVKVIGNCYNMPEIAPDNYITGYFFNFSTFLVDEVRSIINDNFNPHEYQGDVASGMVRLVNFGPVAEKGTEDICKTMYDLIKSGANVFMGEIKNTDGKIMVEKGQSMSYGNIRKINWFVQGVRKTGSFTEVNDDPKGTDFVVHGSPKKDASAAEPSETTSETAQSEDPDAVIIEG